MSQVSCGILKMIPDDCVSVGTRMCVCACVRAGRVIGCVSWLVELQVFLYVK